MSEEEYEEIQKIVISKPEMLFCPVCGNHGGPNTFSILNSYIKPTLGNNVQYDFFKKDTFPCIAIICGKCGHVSLHALGSLTDLSKFAEKYSGASVWNDTKEAKKEKENKLKKSKDNEKH